MGPDTSTTKLIQAIQDDRLADVEDPVATNTCRAIGRRVADEVDAALAVLADQDLIATVEGDPAAPAQRHGARLTLPNEHAAQVAIAALAAAGYRPWDTVDGPAGMIHRKLRGTITLARTSDITMVLEIGWPVDPPPILRRLPSALIPTDTDVDLVRLPESWWPLYVAIRPLRLVAERAGLIDGGARRLGPFLNTPHDLLPSLYELADLTADDVLVDLGCGDGHVLTHAALTRGCGGIGIERDPDLVAEARAEIAEAGLAGRVEIHHGNAAIGPVPEGTVYLIFVPASAAGDLVARVLDQAEPGARIVAHEQHRLPAPPPGARSEALIVGQGVTVAHLWTKR